MPELPEVEVVRRGLADWAVGRSIIDVEVHDERSLRRHHDGANDFVDSLRGATLLGAVRRGKFLWFPLAGADGARDAALMAHLGMSGQLLLQDAGLAPRHLRVDLSLSPRPDAPERLRFVDQRVFGGLWLSPWVDTADGGAGGFGSAEPLIPADAAHIARDALDPLMDAAVLHRAFSGRRIPVKAALLDQSLLSGVGNIYADEALWRSKLHYLTPAGSLGRARVARLLQHTREVMGEALAAGGTSFDSLYVNVNGESGYFARGLNAYGREGERCPRCLESGRPGRMLREAWGGRSSYRCSWCQRAPRSSRS